MKVDEFKDSVVEVLWLIKTCLTTFWFWLPVLYAAYFYVQLWMVFTIHPLTILILPLSLSAYLVLEEKKRTEARYQLASNKLLKRTDPVGGEPELTYFKYSPERSIQRYRESFQEDKEREEGS